jgi:hypothetical protein
VVALISSMTAWWLTRGRPRQLRDLREQPVLDLVPLGGAERLVADGDGQAGLGG